MLDLSASELARLIDHSLLRPHLIQRDIEDGCALAARYHTFSVTVQPCYIELACGLLRGTDVQVGDVKTVLDKAVVDLSVVIDAARKDNKLIK